MITRIQQQSNTAQDDGAMMTVDDIRRVLGVTTNTLTCYDRACNWFGDNPLRAVIVAGVVGAGVWSAFWAGVVEGIIHRAGVYRLVLAAYNDIAGNLGEAWHMGDEIGWLSPVKWGLATAVGMTVFCLVMLAIRRVQTGKWGSDE